ncbi:MAG TPA: DUF2520 domain-containing protein [Wenzhouxiangella sp.]|nr:DUF2520 domain-containing protein [Wenzhouxiangella sp.]
MSTRPTLHILGCGRAARAVARCLLADGYLRPGLVANRSLDSARRAVEFIGAGEPVAQLDERIAGGWLMLGLPDGLLAPASLPQLPAALSLVFHLSGSAEAGVLRSLGERVASVHPVRAFSDPALATKNFAGTWCVAEGDEAALDRLQPVFERAGGRWLPFAATDKAAWHAATVTASNFLVTIHALAVRLARQAGLPEEQAGRVLADLQQGTLESVAALGSPQALTGPVERGDVEACRRLMQAAENAGGDDRALFANLAQATLALARQKRGARSNDASLKDLFT